MEAEFGPVGSVALVKLFDGEVFAVDFVAAALHVVGVLGGIGDDEGGAFGDADAELAGAWFIVRIDEAVADAGAVGDVGDELDAPVGIGSEGGDDAGLGWDSRENFFRAGFELSQGVGVDAEKDEVGRGDGGETGDGPLAQLGAAEDRDAKDGADRGEPRYEQADPGGIHRHAEIFGEGRNGQK